MYYVRERSELLFLNSELHPNEEAGTEMKNLKYKLEGPFIMFVKLPRILTDVLGAVLQFQAR